MDLGSEDSGNSLEQSLWKINIVYCEPAWMIAD